MATKACAAIACRCHERAEGGNVTKLLFIAQKMSGRTRTECDDQLKRLGVATILKEASPADQKLLHNCANNWSFSFGKLEVPGMALKAMLKEAKPNE
jgi:hypothetical protein